MYNFETKPRNVINGAHKRLIKYIDGDVCYDDFVGKVLTNDSIYNIFSNHWVACESVNLPYYPVSPNRYRVKYVGKNYEEVDAWTKSQKEQHDKAYQIFKGKQSRRSMQVIEGNFIELGQIVGIWHGISTDGGLTCKNDLILLPSGKALYACDDWFEPFRWFVENNIFTLESAYFGLAYRGSLNHTYCIDEKYGLSSLEMGVNIFGDSSNWFPSVFYSSFTSLPCHLCVKICNEVYEVLMGSCCRCWL